jgi:hypothetical protein
MTYGSNSLVMVAVHDSLSKIYKTPHVRSEVTTAVTISTIFWDVLSCSLGQVQRRFGGNVYPQSSELKSKPSNAQVAIGKQLCLGSRHRRFGVSVSLKIF